MSTGGVQVLDGTQVIGWDPQRKQIRSWVFDSDGGYGEGWWTQSGNQWTVTSKFQESDGRKGGSTNVFTYVDKNTFKWESVNRTLGGVKLADVRAAAIYRINR